MHACEPQINALPEPNNMGQTVTVTRTSQATTVIDAQGATQGARIVTVDVGVTFADANIPESAGGRSMALRGTLMWGAGSGRFTADFDINSGAQVTLAASSVELSVVFEPKTAEEDRRFKEARVTGAVVWGSRPSTAPVARTLPEVLIETGNQQTFRVPNFSHSVRWLSPDPMFYDASLSAVRLTFHGGPTVMDDPSLVMSPAMGGFVARDAVPFAESARYVTVENIALGPLRVRPTFGLCL